MHCSTWPLSGRGEANGCFSSAHANSHISKDRKRPATELPSPDFFSKPLRNAECQLKSSSGLVVNHGVSIYGSHRILPEKSFVGGSPSLWSRMLLSSHLRTCRGARSFKSGLTSESFLWQSALQSADEIGGISLSRGTQLTTMP